MKKLVAIIAIIAMAFTGCTTGCNKENEVINETLENPEVVSEEVENQGAKEYRVTDETVNAYDFIIETMSKPQYYSDEQYVEGETSWIAEETAAYYETRGVDRTAWVLIDEETATFQRGYTYILTLNFSDYEAIRTNRYTCDEYEEHYDFKDNEFYTVNLKTGHKTDDVINPKTGTNSRIEAMRRCFDEYKELFEKAGCPIVGEPKGTLTKYKNKEIKKLEEVDDGLIHAIWEQDGFEWKWANPAEGLESVANWTDSPDIVWLDDYRDIQYAKAPESDYREQSHHKFVDGTVMDFEVAPYSPVFLVFADESDNSETSPSGEFFALYYITPMMKEIYGYNAVYFTNRENMRKGTNDVFSAKSKEEFNQGGFEMNSWCIVPILNQGNRYVYSWNYLDGYRFQLSANGVKELDRFGNYMKDLCDYYGAEYKFGDDYFDNFRTIFDLETRKLLGLR